MATALAKKMLGNTGMEITQLGFGTVEVGGLVGDVGEEEAGQMYNAVLDAGINFIDTAPDYGEAEERLGRHISQRRSEFFLATKCGCNIDADGVRQEPGHLWTADRVRRNIDQSLARMKTDYVDVLQMHNPTVDDVEKGGLVDVLQEIRAAGKTRFIGVSSTMPNLMPFVRMGVFDTFQIPYSALERRHERMLQEAADDGAGIIVRGGIAQGHRGSDERRAIWERARLDDLLGDMGRYEFMLRFTLTHAACHTTIVGTGNADHFRDNVAAGAGPLAADLYEQVKERLSAAGEGPAD